MMQIGRNLTDPIDGFLADKKFVILDRDSKYSAAFRDLLKGSGVEVVRLPPRSPNLNAYAERFVRSIKDECLNRMIFFGERSLRKATREYAAHYHRERNHQGIDNRLIESDAACRIRLGGVIECRSTTRRDAALLSPRCCLADSRDNSQLQHRSARFLDSTRSPLSTRPPGTNQHPAAGLLLRQPSSTSPRALCTIRSIDTTGALRTTSK